jgi:molybdopterin converting factor small subunit
MSATETKQVHVQYFALLREQSGLTSEVCETGARTPRELFSELSRRHSFSLPVERLAVAVNNEFSRWDSDLAEGDMVVFIPPVAGG